LVGNYGDFSEEYSLRAAATGGQPDFVFRPLDTSKGRGQREVGDCIVWLGSRVLVASVKSRDPSKMGLDTEERAASWLDKNVAAACRQIDGTIRTLKGRGDDLVLTSMRGKEIPWRGGAGVEFFGMVVVDYTPPPGYVASPTSPRFGPSALSRREHCSSAQRRHHLLRAGQ
jgi:hypothetical protein